MWLNRCSMCDVVVSRRIWKFRLSDDAWPSRAHHAICTGSAFCSKQHRFDVLLVVASTQSAWPQPQRPLQHAFFVVTIAHEISFQQSNNSKPRGKNHISVCSISHHVLFFEICNRVSSAAPSPAPAVLCEFSVIVRPKIGILFHNKWCLGSIDL